MNNEKLKLLARLLKEDKITVDEFVILVSKQQQIVYPVIKPINKNPLMPYYYGSGTSPVYCGKTLTTTN